MKDTKNQNNDERNKKIGIIISSNEPNTCWVAIRYAIFHLVEHKDVNIYFVDLGLKYKDISDEKYNTVSLVDFFTKRGGQVFMCETRESLKIYLADHFASLLSKKDISNMSDDDKFQSVMTKDVYVREFKMIL